jgi:hypothetical protein
MVTTETFKRRRSLSGAQIGILLLALTIIGFSVGVMTGISVVSDAPQAEQVVVEPDASLMRRKFCGDELVLLGEASRVVEYARKHGIVCSKGGVL